MSNDIYQKALATAQHEFSKHKRVATAYYNAIDKAKNEMNEAMVNKKQKKKVSRDEDISQYERDRLQNIANNEGFLTTLDCSSNTMPADAVVLWVQKMWLDKILSGEKTMEIRSILGST